MEKRKKILSILIKLLIGIGSFSLIYIRLKSDFTPEKLDLLYASALSSKGILCFVFCLLLIPVNWGIESYKWKVITAPIEQISFKTALKSVYSGVCLGNLAPGRSTEFLAKIIFFEANNRPKITVLHFVNGLFQFSITILIGLLALSFKLHDFGAEYSWLAYATSAGGIVILFILVLCIYKIDAILHFISKKISKQNQLDDFKYSFQHKTLFLLFGFSILRYSVFFSQLCLLIYAFHQHAFNYEIVVGISLYFLITSIIPMISLLEAAIRAAVALVVFKNAGVQNSNLALSIVTLWFLNIVIPSGIGYYFLLKQKFNFKVFASKK